MKKLNAVAFSTLIAVGFALAQAPAAAAAPQRMTNGVAVKKSMAKQNAVPKPAPPAAKPAPNPAPKPAPQAAPDAKKPPPAALLNRAKRN
jgi:hypothetical protein